MNTLTKAGSGRTRGVGLFTLVAATSVALVAAGCSSNSSAEADGAATLEPGQLLSSQQLRGAPVLPSAARSELITYVSQNAQGDPVVVSGTVSIPKTAAPDGGWPVLSWAHGTTGVSDICAPSADSDDGLAHDYLGVVDETLDRYVADGYVVVQTDYVGMGTPGGHPYMDGGTEANAVVDIVRASRDLDDSISNQWYAMGHSQGGHATLFTAAQGAERAPELDLRGAVAIAPGNGTSQTPAYLASGNPAVAPALAFLPLILLGAEAADPSIDADSYVTPTSKALLTAARNGCVAQIRDVIPSVPVDQAFAPGADMDKLIGYLKKQEPAQLKLSVPTMILQGTADTLVAEPGSKALAKALCDSGSTVGYKTYEGADHRAAVADSFGDAEQFFQQLQAGGTPAGTC
ncbi:secretory lipase [Rhodococcus sp. AG1013]|uniref:alpha/beta hydrolase family protein n=1 Tax=Rhodococcus sp. AG1013 TaxID=2183996 RepID=UPI000E2BF98A|nr:lipase family protein [Rhodococcus sp. AG1013]RDI32300.1 secretory lipase [Rhodococcus sp. AG1013]